MRRLNISFTYGAVVLILALSACSSDNTGNPQTATHSLPYFSLAGYFEKEAVRLQQQNPEISKTVAKDGEEEQKNIHVADWEKEFALFIDADINKPAWQNSYRVDSIGFSITYTSTDSTLRTKEIYVEKSASDNVKHIRITNRVDNMLYQTNEQLDYYVDSLYQISKQQQVRIIGKSHYAVTGKWL